MFRDKNLGIGVPNATFVMVRMEVNFMKELHWPANIEVGTGIADFGRTSFTHRAGDLPRRRVRRGRPRHPRLHRPQDAQATPLPDDGDRTAVASGRFRAAEADAYACRSGTRTVETVELVGHLDLAGQPRVRLHVVAEVEHVLLHRRRPADLLAPRLVDIDVAGRAGAGAAALGLDAGHVVLDRRFHHGRADLGIDRAGGAGGIDEGDLGHGPSAVGKRRPDGRAAFI